LVALHGRIADVICLDCRETSSRAALHARMTSANPGFAEDHAAVAVRPDGDVELDATEAFVVPDCVGCGGVLKPDVVFFGENVPAPRVERCYAAVDDLAPAGGTLLVAGSSLTVMSGLRFARRAAKAGTPVVIVNRGPTRGDDLAAYKLDVGCSEFLGALALAPPPRSFTG
jgi:NAD-dependent SIR2 family protein deacetylase